MTRTLLYVEDDATQARPMVRWLEARGWTVFHAATVESASLLVESVSAIVTDWNLRGETAEPIVRAAQTSRVPCVIYSGTFEGYMPWIGKPDLDALRAWLGAV